MDFSFLNLKKKDNIQMPETHAMGLLDILAPPAIKFGPDTVEIGQTLARTYFVFSFPRYLNTGWLSPIVNLDTPMDLSIFMHPVNTGMVLKKLRKKVTEVQSEIMEKEQKGLIRDPVLENAYRDIEVLRDKLQTAEERMFQVGIYITVYAQSKGELDKIEGVLRSLMESKMVYVKPALYQQDKGFASTSPYGTDKLLVHTSMNTSPFSTTFPFISFDLSSNEGILYGVNTYNNSLVLFDRFESVENANMVVFGKSGGGKSYAVKLEILRSLMLGVDVIIIDPENEYKYLAEAVGGSFYDVSLKSENHVNPFDLPLPLEDENAEDVIRSNIINLVGLMRVMLGTLTSEEDSLIDQAINETYAARDINKNTDPTLWGNRTPLLSDLESVLETMDGAESLVKKIRKFTKGVYSGFFNFPTNITMKNNVVVFGIKNLEPELKPMAMFIVMRYIWNTVKEQLKKRILVIDEAWWLMQSPDSASFLYGIVKRGRKYWLGTTTITQDVNDFMKSEYGQPIITNSSLQLLMKQSSASIDVVQKTFNLTDEEKYLLLESPIGEGIFFAGDKHVAMRVLASYTENQLITTSPEELLKIQELRRLKKQ
ncbi:MAG: ATP-binding protein [Candidatus Paceibacterota bacterium]|jgi:type IV secretory pathway VirB4 component|nr:ATP-binding protein [Candidatus Paceibacterota bacterium]